MSRATNLLSFFFKTGRKGEIPVQLGHNRIYILPTKSGAAFFLLLVVMLMISINFNNPPGYLLTFLLAGVGLVALFHTHRGISGLLVNYGQASPVFAGSSAVFPVLIRNPTRLPRYAIQAGWTRSRLDTAQDIEPEKEVRIDLSAPAPRRGLLRPGRIIVGTVYPLGLFKAWSAVDLPLRCTIFPTPDPESSARMPSTAADNTDQGQAKYLEGDEFSGLRTYRRGDSMHRVAWKAVARGDTLVSKDFIGTSGKKVLWLDWDAVSLDSTEAKLSRLCRWVLDAEKSGHPYGLRIPGKTLAPSRGYGQMHGCLTVLALFEMPGDQSSSP